MIHPVFPMCRLTIFTPNRMGDTKSTPCSSSGLHLSVIKIRPYKGQLICLKKCLKSFIFPITRQTSVLYHCQSYFLGPQCCKSRFFEDSTDNCIVVPTIAFQYRESVGQRISRGCFQGSTRTDLKHILLCLFLFHLNLSSVPQNVKRMVMQIHANPVNFVFVWVPVTGIRW